MLHRHYTLGLEAARTAAEVVFAEATRDGMAMAVAVMDDHGDLLYCARMDGAHARVLQHAIRKAYTAATMQRATLKFKQDLHDRGRDLADWGDSRLTTLQGGHPVVWRGQTVGAVGAGGNVAARDEEVAILAVQALVARLEAEVEP